MAIIYFYTKSFLRYNINNTYEFSGHEGLNHLTVSDEPRIGIARIMIFRLFGSLGSCNSDSYIGASINRKKYSLRSRFLRKG